MTDHRLRDIERRARQGDPEAQRALEAAMGRLQADPAMDALWTELVSALERENEGLRGGRRLEVDVLARTVQEVCADRRAVTCAWTPARSDSEMIVRAFVARVDDDVTIAIGKLFDGDGSWGSATEDLHEPDPAGCGYAECCPGSTSTVVSLGPDAPEGDVRAWCEEAVQALRLRTTRPLALEWAGQVLGS